MNKPPHIIFIILDTLRADRVSYHEKNNTITPFLNKLIEHSICFENCIANVPWTLPSHISMFTGLYPSQSTLLSGQVDRVSNNTPILAEILRDLGYYTICFSENVYVSKKFGLSRGFDYMENPWIGNIWINKILPFYRILKLLYKIDKDIKNKKISNFLEKIWASFKNFCELIVKFIEKTFLLKKIIFNLKNNTLRDLEIFFNQIAEQIKNQPIFLFFNFLTPHDPYIPFRESLKKLNISWNNLNSIKEIIFNPLKYRININFNSKRLSLKRSEAIKTLYDACVHSSDMVIKKLYEYFKKLSLLENSYIIITSDHGEHLGNKEDHGLWEHCTYISLYEGVLKVPLLIYNEHFRKQVIHEQVQLKDLFHTILHVAAKSEEKCKYLKRENSILYQIKNKSTPPYIFGEFLKYNIGIHKLVNRHRRNIKQNLIPKIINHLYFLRTNRYKYIKFDKINHEEIYDLKEDPWEQKNLRDIKPEILAELRKKMESFLNHNKDKQTLIQIVTEREKDVILKGIQELLLKRI
ncbi:MAG: sulfatase family protein [Candidatus Helarchaeota archaeon]